MKKFTVEDIKKVVESQNQYAFDYSDNYDWGILITLDTRHDEFIIQGIDVNSDEERFFTGISQDEYLEATKNDTISIEDTELFYSMIEELTSQINKYIEENNLKIEDVILK